MQKIYYNSKMENIETTLYKLLGGEAGLRSLVDRFYDVMDSAPEAAQIRALHPDSLQQSREKLFMFLSGWSGGPPLYIQTYGHPRLRQRHMPFPIGKTERDQWLWCMDKALAESPFDVQVIEYLKGRFVEIANSMQNRVNIDL
jgi:hemoglobin